MANTHNEFVKNCTCYLCRSRRTEAAVRAS